MESLFGIKTIKSSAEFEDVVVKKITIFDYLNDITYLKTGRLPEERDPEMRGWNSYMILRYLSLDKYFLPIINILNEYQEILTSKELYLILVHIIPRGKKFLSYPKLNEKIYEDEEVELLKKYFDCSKFDMIEYLNLGLITNREIEQIKNKIGGKYERR